MTTPTTDREYNLQERLLRATVPYSLMALGLHMAEHQLPLFRTIDTPTVPGDPDRIRIHLAPEHAATWVETIDVDEEQLIDRGRDRDFRWETRQSGRLPAAGVQVELFQLHTRVPRPLTVVPR